MLREGEGHTSKREELEEGASHLRTGGGNRADSSAYYRPRAGQQIECFPEPFIMDRLRSLPTYAPAGSHACGCGWGVVQIYYLYWLVGVCAYVCVCGLCLSNGGLAPV